jgi:FecR-like protein
MLRLLAYFTLYQLRVIAPDFYTHPLPSREGRNMYLHTIILFVFVSLASSFLPGPAQAQSDRAQPAIQNIATSPIGKVVTVAGSVTIEHVNAVAVQANLPSQTGQTKVGDLVYQGDVVRTGSDGRVSITFADDTSFNLSKNAQMTLDEFVYDPNGKSNSTVFNLSKGAFTFVAGKIAKNGDMKVETPVATMGIRGTTPHVEISEDGTTKFSTLIEEGKSQVVKKLGAPAEQPQQKPDQKLKLNICRGC